MPAHKIAILGDFNLAHNTHHALNESARQVQKSFPGEIRFDWIDTDKFDYQTAFNDNYCGLWIAPGSPYKSMENVLETIRYTREHQIPTFGNCGGFQHMIIEFARNVCGIEHADHEESNPAAPELLISKLSCTLTGVEEMLRITDTNSLLCAVMQKENFTGKYFCSYGINNKYVPQLISNGISFTAIAPDGEMRAFELKGHPFFLGTLFQPALTTGLNGPNPIIAEFTRRCTLPAKFPA